MTIGPAPPHAVGSQAGPSRPTHDEDASYSGSDEGRTHIGGAKPGAAAGEEHLASFATSPAEHGHHHHHHHAPKKFGPLLERFLEDSTQCAIGGAPAGAGPTQDNKEVRFVRSGLRACIFL